MHFKYYLIGFCLTLFVSSCTWVKLSPEAQDIQVLSIDEVSHCKKRGQTTVSLKDRIIGIKRNQHKIKRELETLGKNSATRLEGDSIVAASDIIDGKQTFDVYKCN